MNGIDIQMSQDDGKYLHRYLNELTVAPESAAWIPWTRRGTWFAGW